MGVGEGLILFLQLIEQPHVLDGDDRLVGEGLEQGDLPLRKEVHLGAAEDDRTDRDPLPDQGDAEHRAGAYAPRGAFGKLVRLGLHVSNVDGPPLQHRPATDHPGAEGAGELADGAWAGN
jgi:hypothetical protein